MHKLCRWLVRVLMGLAVKAAERGRMMDPLRRIENLQATLEVCRARNVELMRENAKLAELARMLMKDIEGSFLQLKVVQDQLISAIVRGEWKRAQKLAGVAHQRSLEINRQWTERAKEWKPQQQ